MVHAHRSPKPKAGSGWVLGYYPRQKIGSIIVILSTHHRPPLMPKTRVFGCDDDIVVAKLIGNRRFANSQYLIENIPAALIS